LYLALLVAYISVIFHLARKATLKELESVSGHPPRSGPLTAGVVHA